MLVIQNQTHSALADLLRSWSLRQTRGGSDSNVCINCLKPWPSTPPM
jgi:hypothetical protein